MNRIFQLTNEFSSGGPESLASLLCATEGAVLWTPAYQVLKKVYESKGSILSPKGLIELIEDEEVPIQIMGRQEWLTDKTFRKHHHWEPARIWDTNFDEVICRLALEDHSKPLKHRRVIISAPEQGWEKAEERLSDNDGNLLRENLHKLYQSKKLPPGILERVAIKETRGVDPALSILRDIIDHFDAVKECEATGSALDPQYCQFLNDLHVAGLNIDLPVVSVPDEPEDSTKVNEALSLLKLITPLTNEKRLIRFMRSKERKQLLTLLFSDYKLPLRLGILDRIIASKDNRSYLKRIIPGFSIEDPIELSLTIGGLVTLVLTSMLTTPFNWGWLVFAAKVFREELRRHDLIPAYFDSKGSGTSPIFYLCFGTTRPNNKEIEKIRLRLLRDIEKEA